MPNYKDRKFVEKYKHSTKPRTKVPELEYIPLEPKWDEYNKQRIRINNTINRLKEEGFDVPSNFYLRVNPGKTPTADDIEFLREVTPEFLRSKSTFVDKETGEILEYKGKQKQQIKDIIKGSKNPKPTETNNNSPYIAHTFSNGEFISREIPENSLPSVDTMYDTVKQLILDAPPSISFRKEPGKDGWVTYDTDDIKNSLVSMLDDLYAENEDADAWLYNNYGEIENCLVDLYADSSGEEVEQGYVSLVFILNGGSPLNMKESTLASNIFDSYNWGVYV